MDSKRRTIAWISASLSAALLAVVGGAGGGALATPDDGGAGGGQGGTATAVAGEGDTATAVPGQPGADGPELQLPLELLDVTAPELGELVMSRYAAQLPVGDDIEEDPNAHIDDSGHDGASVSVIGSGDEAVTVTGENGANGSTMSAPETAETATTAEETLSSPAVGPVTIFGER